MYNVYINNRNVLFCLQAHQKSSNSASVSTPSKSWSMNVGSVAGGGGSWGWGIAVGTFGTDGGGCKGTVGRPVLCCLEVGTWTREEGAEAAELVATATGRRWRGDADDRMAALDDVLDVGALKLELPYAGDFDEWDVNRRGPW